MREINRQVVIFGNFKSIGFNIVTQLGDIIKKYEFTIEAVPDFIQQKGPNGIQLNQIIPVSFIPQVFSQQNFRPALKSKVYNLAVFIGSNRIHIEQNDSTTELYNQFLTSAVEILNKIVEKNNGITINRLALNGNIILEDTKKIKELYSNTFKPSPLYGTNSDEFAFRINTKEESKELRNTVNKIISFERTNEILQNQETRPIVLVNYDYNTAPNEKSIYSLDDLNVLINLTKKYKTLI